MECSSQYYTFLFPVLLPQKMFHLTLACGVSLTISNIPLHLVVITLQRFRLHISFLVFLYWEAHEIQQSAALMQIQLKLNIVDTAGS